MKIKTILYLAGILVLASLVISVNTLASKLKKQRQENARIEANNLSLLDDLQVNKTLYLTAKEVVGRISRERDSLAAALKIKPKQVETIVQVFNTEVIHDTVPVPVQVVGIDSWRIQDSGDCFKWEANATRRGDSLDVERTKFEYNNRTVQTYYRERPQKFLGIRFGKWVYKTRTSSDCGDTRTETVHFIK
jgi:hypothetical protein